MNDLLTHIGYGFFLAFVGFVTPAMLNMTTVRTSLEQGKRSGILFASGAALINMIQAFIAFSSLRYLDSNPEVILWLKRIGIVVLFLLAFIFYKKSKTVVSAKDKKENMPSFAEGMLMSTLNMLALPYYFGTALGLESSEKIFAVGKNIYGLSFGVFLGGFAMFSIYAIAANAIAARSEFITKNINLLLSVLFVLLGTFVLFEIAF